MANIALRGLKVVGNLWREGNADRMLQKQLQNKLAETFVSGEFVKTDGTPELLLGGTVVGAGDDRLDVSVHQTTANFAAMLFGIAVDSAPASGQAFLHTEVLTPGVIVEANLVQGTDGDIPTNHTLVRADLYSLCALLFDSTNKRWYFAASAAEQCVQIIRIGLGVAGDSLGAIGDVNARVYGIIGADILKLNVPST